MRLLDRITAWRRHRARKAYERERAWQKPLQQQDAQAAIRDMTEGSAMSQAVFPPNQ